ncbi:hypothetical protein [Nocardioides sp. NPDC006273]|uniref:hypothetical protein n=1 Tax=Nocardioides sp. NPDC006273 TaxID=3155598 RepID=UPI0033B6A1B3
MADPSGGCDRRIRTWTRPSRPRRRSTRGPPETHETALYLLTLVDIRTLVEAPYNEGFLYGQADVANSEVYAEFRDARQELVDAYGRLGMQVASPNVASDFDARELGEMLMHSVEVVTVIRNAGLTMTPERANRIAAAALRTCDVPNETIATAASAASVLLAEFRHETTTALAEMIL